MCTIKSVVQLSALLSGCVHSIYNVLYTYIHRQQILPLREINPIITSHKGTRAHSYFLYNKPLSRNAVKFKLNFM
jgi:hypothetical protein